MTCGWRWRRKEIRGQQRSQGSATSENQDASVQRFIFDASGNHRDADEKKVSERSRQSSEKTKRNKTTQDPEKLGANYSRSSSHGASAEIRGVRPEHRAQEETFPPRSRILYVTERKTVRKTKGQKVKPECDRWPRDLSVASPGL